MVSLYHRKTKLLLCINDIIFIEVIKSKWWPVLNLKRVWKMSFHFIALGFILKWNDPIFLLHFLFRVNYCFIVDITWPPWTNYITTIKISLKGFTFFNQSTYLESKSFLLVKLEKRQNQKRIIFIYFITGKPIKFLCVFNEAHLF